MSLEFQANQFKFPKGFRVPDHQDSEPDVALRNVNEYYVESYQPPSQDIHVIAINVTELATGILLTKAYRAKHGEKSHARVVHPHK